MKIQRIPPIFAINLALLTLVGCVSSETTIASEKDAPAQPLVGAWRSQVQFESGSFATVKGLEFMYAFNAGGTMTESSNYDAAPPVPPAYGVWRRTGERQFEAKYLFYTTKPPARFDEIASGAGWTPAGHGELVERIAISADARSFTSTLTLQLFNSSGKLVEGGGRATGRAQRVEFDMRN